MGSILFAQTWHIVTHTGWPQISDLWDLILVTIFNPGEGSSSVERVECHAWAFLVLFGHFLLGFVLLLDTLLHEWILEVLWHHFEAFSVRYGWWHLIVIVSFWSFVKRFSYALTLAPSVTLVDAFIMTWIVFGPVALRIKPTYHFLAHFLGVHHIVHNIWVHSLFTFLTLARAIHEWLHFELSTVITHENHILQLVIIATMFSHSFVLASQLAWLIKRVV